MKRNLTLAALAFAMFAGTMGFAAAQDGRYSDRDDYRYDRDYHHDGYRNDFREGIQRAGDIGYQDGMQVGREDSWHGKRFNPYPRGHNHADRGYSHEFGSRHEYREHYTQAYHEGYERGYQNNNGRGYYR
jgi:Ni/Co efflux regulator RcnB